MTDTSPGRLLPTLRWRAKHQGHIEPDADFQRQPFNHPDGTWYWLVCPCGHRHLTTTETDK